jgi:hypothetical protein
MHLLHEVLHPGCQASTGRCNIPPDLIGSALVRDFVQGEFDQVKSQVKDENGWRVQRIAMAAGALAASSLRRCLASLRTRFA